MQKKVKVESLSDMTKHFNENTQGKAYVFPLKQNSEIKPCQSRLKGGLFPTFCLACVINGRKSYPRNVIVLNHIKDSAINIGSY